jgi:hypothetical protein
MKPHALISSAVSAAIASTLFFSAATYGQSAPGGTPATGPTGTGPAAVGTVPTAPRTVPNPAPGTTNTVAPMPTIPPGAVAAPVPPIGSQVTPPATATLPGNQPLNPGLANTRMPTRSDSATSAFQSLDPTNRGYVTRAETDRIPGFTGFDNADTNRDGHLSPDEFSAAWKFYSGQ